MSAAEGKKYFWQQPVGWALLWPVPVILALMGHFFAWPKVMLRDCILLMNARTERALDAWWFASEYYPLFLVYALILMAAFVLLRVGRVRIWLSLVVFALLSLPGLWYFREMAYLGGKLIGFMQ